jgi:hypothetical protein
MAATQQIAPMPLVTLENGMTVTLAAIDPATGAAITGVVISDAAVYVTAATPDEPLAEPPVLLAYSPDE